MIVVDASLAVKWLFNENGSEHALRLLDEQRGGIAGPDLIFVEVAGVIVRRGNEVKAYGPDALETLRVWASTVFGHAVRSHPVTSKLLFEASSMALRIGHPLKDCLYLALAMELDCDLVTCDARFRDKARPLGATVTLLQEWAARN